MSSPTQSDKVEIGESNLDYADRVAREQSDKTLEQEVTALMQLRDIETLISYCTPEELADQYDHLLALSTGLTAALTAREERLVREAVDATHYKLLERFNEANADGLNDINILTNSDSWHEEIKQLKAQLTSHGKDVKTQ